MSLRMNKLLLPVVLALGAATGAHAQDRDQAVLPVWNNSGQIEALLVLEPTDIEEMLSEEWDLSLFTCTFGGATRITVRCERLSNR